MRNEEPNDFGKRDVETFFIIGGFVLLLSIPVGLGVLWEDDYHARVVTLAAAGALFLIGGGLIVRAISARKRLK